MTPAGVARDAWRVLCSLGAAAVLGATPAVADIRLEQAGPEALHLQEPATRLVSLAPHLAELVFAAGAGDLLLATVAYSDYPAAAARLPRIGDAFRFDLERILSLKPDLVLAWDSGNPASALLALENLGLRVWHVEINRPEDIADTLEAIGAATGHEASAAIAAQSLRARLDALRRQYAGRPPVRYFYQIGARPLYTVNGKHLISQSLSLCGGENVFAGINALAPQITHESVLQANPEALLAGRLEGSDDEPLAQWREWPRLQAVQKQAFFYLNADHMNRATPRLLDAVEQACQWFDQYREEQP